MLTGGNTETSLKAQALVSDRLVLQLKVFTRHLSHASGPALVGGNTTANRQIRILPTQSYLTEGTQKINKLGNKLMGSCLFKSYEGDKTGDIVYRWGRESYLNMAAKLKSLIHSEG